MRLPHPPCVVFASGRVSTSKDSLTCEKKYAIEISNESIGVYRNQRVWVSLKAMCRTPTAKHRLTTDTQQTLSPLSPPDPMWAPKTDAGVFLARCADGTGEPCPQSRRDSLRR